MPTAPSPRAARLAAAFAAEELAGLRLAARVRLGVLLVLAVWITIENRYHSRFFFYYPFLAAFAALGYAPVWLSRGGRYRGWVRYLLPALDTGLLTVTTFLPNPLDPQWMPPQLMLRFGNEMYLFVLICAAVFTYSPALVLWTGFCAALAWSIATVHMVALPDTIVTLRSADWEAMNDTQRLAAIVDPYRVNVGLWGRQVVLFLVSAAALAVFVHRARRLVARQADAERERANLSRYFSPNQVEELAQSDAPLGPTRQQQVAILFADLVGFTSLAEALPAPAVIELLRNFHARMQRAVFAHGGTVDKYVGDAIMATFGTPRSGRDDATNALRCVAAMRTALADGNAERTASGAAPLRVGVGAHYGAVVLGDIGGESRLEFAVIGDAVNIASRLERLTRELGSTVVVSEALVAAARREAAADLAALLADLTPGPPQALRGRAEPVGVWRAA
ncbi:MAG: adenylate/guanylate cyclase domain-containing protein [Deltaproteobacteria bacterium]|nr:adenylate/guanylate cyclase domain-containing protein [Deltaproteobacteria bacterium]